MGDEELINYILRSRERGRTKEQIMRALCSVGWKKEKVEAAFRRIDDPNFLQSQSLLQPQQQPTPQPQPSSVMQQTSASAQQPTMQPVPQATDSQAQKPAAPSPQQAAQPLKSPLSFLSNLFKKPSQHAAPQQESKPLSSVEQAQTQKQSSLQFSQYSAVPPWIATTPTVTISFSSQQPPPSSALPPQKQPPPPQKPGSEEFAKNPAFSNLAAAISSIQPKKSALPLALAAVALLLIAAFFLFQQQSEKQPEQPSYINLSKLEAEKKNATKNATTLKKPVVITQPSPNVTRPNASAAPRAQNKTETPNVSAQKNTTTPPSPPNQTEARNSSLPAPIQQFASYSRYNSSQGFPPSKFCQQLNAALYRVHYIEFADTECTQPRGAQGHAYPMDFPYACEEIPCCYSYKTVSRLYDWFECGHYS
ncbi:MAG: hypothetical protein N3G80_03840 [Candidatus Micrarchaeota archaeon]|nr:hypothetical protein [Candidatus Micrarchaeota archaeon]